MSSAVTLELLSLPLRHPNVGQELLDAYGPRAIVRLTRSSCPPANCISEPLQVSWLRRPGDGPSTTRPFDVGWAGCDAFRGRLPQVRLTANGHTITEHAAIVVMALVVHDLEGEIIRSVVPIGGGPDYLLYRGETSGGGVLEVSGVERAEVRSIASGRLAQKTSQLLRDAEAGYVSVTTFSYPLGDRRGVHSFLHYVRRPASAADRGQAMIPEVDSDGSISRVALAAEALLGEGDVLGARRKHEEAGQMFLRRLSGAKSPGEKHLLRFLAATQFFRGGLHDRAFREAARVQASFLPPEVRDPFPRFFQAVKERSRVGYAKGVREQLARHWKAGETGQSDAAAALRLLQDNPYIIPDAANLAFLRGAFARRVGDYSAAASFFATAYRFRPDTELVAMAAGLTYNLGARGAAEAQLEYSADLAEALPHAITFASAALARYRRAGHDPVHDRTSLLKDAIRYSVLAKEAFAELGPADEGRPSVREFVHYAYFAAGMAHLRLGDNANAMAVADAGIERWPDLPELWIVRGLARDLDPRAEADFRRAVELRAADYCPYYYLSKAAFDRGQFQEALAWAHETVSHVRPGQAGLAGAIGWLATCLSACGAPRAEIAAALDAALQINPNYPGLREAHEALAAAEPRPFPELWGGINLEKAFEMSPQISPRGIFPHGTTTAEEMFQQAIS